MPEFIVSVPASVTVRVTADTRADITEDTVEGALQEQHGKYITLDARTDLGVEEFTILDED